MDHDDFATEPIRGLPEELPEGERILWQGSPDPWALAKEALKIRWVAGYFGLLFAWRSLVASADLPVAEAVLGTSIYLLMGVVTCAILWAVAWVQAKATVYTITNRRVALRIGAALTMTVQFPFLWIGAADLVTRPDGTGTIALRTLGRARFSYLLLWPHARPWRFAKPQPALRCVKDAARVARILAEAVEGQGLTPAQAPDPSPAPDMGGALPMPAE